MKRVVTISTIYELIFLFAFLFFIQSIQNANAAHNTTLSMQLDKEMKFFERNQHFMGTVLIVKDEHVLLKKSYGMANLEWNIANTINTKFLLGSITKQFTAVSILQLVEQHKLSLYDKACRYFEGCPNNWKDITIHQLLSHTSGIPNYTEERNFMKFNSCTSKSPAEILATLKNNPLEFSPGTHYHYDNSDYILLGIIIKKISGESYADYLNNHIFGPLGMLNSGYENQKVILYHRASGYKRCEKRWCNADYLDMSLPFSAGALYSTVDDLYKWDRALYTNKILNKKSQKQMFTVVMNNYGYGVDLRKIAHHIQIGHNGRINGFSTYIARFPKDHAVIILLSNVEAVDTKLMVASLAKKLFN